MWSSDRSLRIHHVRSQKEELLWASSVDSIENPHRLAAALLPNAKPGRETFKTFYRPYLRCSGLHAVCVREQVLGWRLGKEIIRRHGDGLQVTFDIGHATHYFMQNSRRYFRNVAVGWWECAACGWKRFGRVQAQTCPKCGAHPRAFFYSEHHMLLDNPFRLSGHPDMFLEVASGEYRVTEIKTINGEAFKDLCAPLGDHIVQVTGYMMGLEHDKSLPIRVNTQSALIIYVSKAATKGQSPMKAFHVGRTEAYENMILEELDHLQRAVDDPGHNPPGDTRCIESNWQVYRAKVCPVRKECRAIGCC